MLQEVGIDDRAARRLMAIARNAGIKSANFADLPASPTALYELSLIDPESIESGIEHGDIHPAMTIRDAKGYAQEITERDTPANVNTETGENPGHVVRETVDANTEQARPMCVRALPGPYPGVLVDPR